MMDYRELLKRYIMHVRDMEGYDFIPDECDEDHGLSLGPAQFTVEEQRELIALAVEAEAEYQDWLHK